MREGVRVGSQSWSEGRRGGRNGGVVVEEGVRVGVVVEEGVRVKS